ncbi:MAG: radical SAM family heme chaperone HemW, partial [Hyphomicrobiaceae bacterium]
MTAETGRPPLVLADAGLFDGDDPGFGVYVHWPFCASKCPYCDFNSHVRMGGIDEKRFLAAFCREIDRHAALTGPRTVASIFFGGGTPSLMAPETVGAILAHIARCWHVANGAEMTLEANPSSVEAQKFLGYRAAGIDRVSLGVQSLRDADLKTLGRLHTAAEAKAAIAIAQRTFARTSFDLISARPGQTIASWHAELSEALALAAGHLSLYQLTIEAGTPFAALHAAGKLAVPADAVAEDLYFLTQDLTAAAGLPAYEVSNHARSGEESRHNLLYWRYGTYAGIGPGAHGRLPVGGERHATVAERHPERWLAQVETAGHGLTETSPLTPSEQADEMLLMGLRLVEGLDLTRLAALSGLQPAPQTIDRLAAQGLLERSGNRIRAIGRGRFLLNTLILDLARSHSAV